MPNKWVEFVKRWSKDHGLSYMCSIGNPKLKSDYQKFKSTGEEYEFYITPSQKKKRPTKQARERSSMGSEDANVLMRKRNISTQQLEQGRANLNNFKNLRELVIEDVVEPEFKLTKKEEIKLLVEEMNQYQDELIDVSNREEAILKKIDASKKPSPIIIKQATNLRKKKNSLSQMIEDLSVEIEEIKSR
jgi:hypothetical protein